MKPLICTQCGAKINPKTMCCEYCGTHFESENNVLTITTSYVRPVVFDCSVAINKEAVIMDPEMVADYTRNQLAKKLADIALQYMETTTFDDPEHQIVQVKGRIRVLPPDYRF